MSFKQSESKVTNLVVSGLRSRLLWRDSLNKFPSVPLISLQAQRRCCRSEVWVELQNIAVLVPAQAYHTKSSINERLQGDITAARCTVTAWICIWPVCYIFLWQTGITHFKLVKFLHECCVNAVKFENWTWGCIFIKLGIGHRPVFTRSLGLFAVGDTRPQSYAMASI